jgi:hypothetical protein
MPALRDPSALVRHAAEAGDRALMSLLADRLGGRASSGGPARRAFLILVLTLEIGDLDADELSDG